MANNRYSGFLSAVNANANFEYSAATEYYKALKQKALEEVQANLLKRGLVEAKKDADNFIANLEEEWAKESDAAQYAKDLALEQLNSIETLVTNIVENSISKEEKKNIRNLINTEHQKRQQKIAEGKQYKTNYQKLLIEAIRKQLTNNQSYQLLLSQLQAMPLYSQAAENVKVQFMSYATRLFIQQFRKVLISTRQGSYINALKGYYYEDAVVDALNNLTKQVLNITDNGISLFIGSGTVTIGNTGSQSPGDAILNVNFLDENTALQVFKQNISGSAQIDLSYLQRGISNDVLLNSISSFSAQIKTWKFDTSGIRNFYQIGSRAKLRDMLWKSKLYGKGYSLSSNIAFMGQKLAILEALGPTNILFIDGKQRYWMDDFISMFRNKRFYLMLQTKRDEKGRMRATSEVALYNYSNAKSHLS